jgi:hypothetical protein
VAKEMMVTRMKTMNDKDMDLGWCFAIGSIKCRLELEFLERILRVLRKGY